MRKTLRVSLLVVLLACSVHAGDIIQNGVVSTPPPPPAATTVMEVQEPQTSVDPITEIFLTFLSNVLSIF